MEGNVINVLKLGRCENRLILSNVGNFRSKHNLCIGVLVAAFITSNQIPAREFLAQQVRRTDILERVTILDDLIVNELACFVVEHIWVSITAFDFVQEFISATRSSFAASNDVNREPFGFERLHDIDSSFGRNLSRGSLVIGNMVHTDVITGDASVHKLDLHGLQGLNLVAILVCDGHVEGDHVVDGLSVGLGGCFDGARNRGGVDLAHDDLGALGKRALGSRDLHGRPTRMTHDRLRRVTSFGAFGALGFSRFLFGCFGIVCGIFSFGSGCGNCECTHCLLGRKLELLLLGSCAHEVATRHGLGCTAVGNREHMRVAL